MPAVDGLPDTPSAPSGSVPVPAARSGPTPAVPAVPGPAGAPPAAPHEASSFDLERITFFSDAVVAIAMTLLVIDLRLPEWLTQTATDADLQRALGELARPMFACALSFFVIAMWWFGHHRIFRTLRDVDSRIVALDLVFLGAIVFLPFPTTMIGRFANLTTALVIYAGTNVVAGGSLSLMRLRAERVGLYLPGIPRAQLRRQRLYGLIGPAVFAASIPIAFIAPGFAALSWNAIWMLAVGMRLWYRVEDRRVAAPPEPTAG
jgi:uncharacterized membrane protein